MASLDFEGRVIPIRDGDTVAAALYRAGVRTFSRSFKYHRPRGLYCCTGDCPNCMVTIDGEPATRSCVRAAKGGQRVARGSGWPSADHDLLKALWYLRPLLPVGFYYKMFATPSWVWPRLEPIIRRVAGIGPIDLAGKPDVRERLNHHPDVFVAGGGVAGLSAALQAAEVGESVVLANEDRIGTHVAPGPTRDAIDDLHTRLRRHDRATILESAAATGVYEGPLVTVPSHDFLHLVHPGRIVVATGAVERHGAFDGNDLPGVWLGRGAARMAGVFDLAPASRAVVVATTEESMHHIEVLTRAGVSIAAVVVPKGLAERVPSKVPTIVNGEIVAARGTTRVRSVVVRTESGTEERIVCDALVLSLGLAPRDVLLRQSLDGEVTGAGDVVHPGCSLEEAIASGRAAARGERWDSRATSQPVPRAASCGFVCLCEDVSATDLTDAWREGFQSTELLKRYTTATMGPCQGILCQSHLQGLVASRTHAPAVSQPTTARPPARSISVEEAAAGNVGPIEHRTALHERHLELGATMEWTGVWKRPERYGDVLDEYWAVRRGVSIMDVGTLGKYRVRGRHASEFLERLSPASVASLKPGRMKYGLLLNEAGYVFDDGLIGALSADDYYLTFSSGGADAAEAWLREWAEAWKLQPYIVNQTAALGAINLAGPRSRELLQRLTSDPVDGGVMPHTALREISVAGIRCLTLRVGFVGELSFELHHPASESVRLWNALLEAGADLGIRPHGLEALRLLRLEKAHIIISQDTDFDTTPAKIGMNWAVRMDKADFVGRPALERLALLPMERRLATIVFPGEHAPVEGAQLYGVKGRHVGYLTSSRFSPVLGHGVALGWISTDNGDLPESIVAVSDGNRRTQGNVVTNAPYDPDGVRLRA
jgi:sarcosine oxidase subunit alpha